METVPCKSCNAPLVWLRTAAGKAMPCDPALVTIVTDDGRTVRGRMPHWSTCPTAARHRPPRGRAEPESDATTPED